MEGTWKMPHGEREASIKALEDAILGKGGAPIDVFNRFRMEKDYATRAAGFLLQDILAGGVSHEVAREIMGANFFGPEEWGTHYSLRFSKTQLLKAFQFPWGEGVLDGPCPFYPRKRVAETHFAFLGTERIPVPDANGKLHKAPLSIMGWHQRHPKSKGQPYFHFDPDPWYSKKEFAAKVLRFRWYLLLKEIVPHSTSKTWEEQGGMIPSEYEVPNAVVEVSKDMLCYTKNSVYLNPSVWARCDDIVHFGGRRADVGCFGANGLHVGRWHDARDSHIGVAVSRKLPANLEA